MDNDLWLRIQTHRDLQRSEGKFRCSYERTVVRLDQEIHAWVCGECGEVILDLMAQEV